MEHHRARSGAAEMIVYGVHSYAWGRVGEVEILSTHRSRAEAHARERSADWPYGSLVVTSRALDDPGGVWVVSEWRDGAQVSGHADGGGQWRKVRPVC